MSSASKIRSVLLAKGMDVSGRTVSRRLVDDFGLKARKPAKKPRLTPAMKVKRLGFAKKHAKWTIQQWQQVFFSDESTVQQFTTRHRHVRRSTGKRFDEGYTTQSMKHPPSVMIWGGTSVNGTARLFFLPPGTTMNGQSTLICWRTSWNYIWPSINAKFLCRMVHHVTTPKALLSFWNRRKFKSWTDLETVRNLNPIENLWTVLRDRVSEKQPASAKELVDAIKAVWVHE